MKILKENGILLSQFARNVVEARFLRNIVGWHYSLGHWFKIKFPVHRPKNKILFWSVRQNHGGFEVNLLLIYFIKCTKLQESFINCMLVCFVQWNESKQFWDNFIFCFNKWTLSQKYKKAFSWETALCKDMNFIWLSPVMKQLLQKI